MRQVSLNETVSFVYGRKSGKFNGRFNILERKNKLNYINGFKFQHLPLNFPLNILVKITGTGHSFKVNITKI